MNTLSIRNWERFQGYKRRGPPWIKLHVGLLENYEFYELPERLGLAVILLWLLASRTDNSFPDNADWLSQAIHLPIEPADIEALVGAKWLVRKHNDNSVAAPATRPSLTQRRNRSPETETETEAERETEKVKTFGAGAPERENTGQDNRSPVQVIVGLTVRHLYHPDGEPPHGWTLKQDGSVAKAMLKNRRFEDICHAIEGLRYLRDYPGRYGERVGFPIGEKVTLKALYNMNNETVAPLFERARSAYFKRQELDPRPKNPTRLEIPNVEIG